MHYYHLKYYDDRAIYGHINIPKLESKVKKRCIGLAVFPLCFAILCRESPTGSVHKYIKRPGYNVIMDGWAGVFNPVPHPLPPKHTTAVT